MGIINIFKKLDDLTKTKSTNKNISPNSMEKYNNIYPENVINRNNKRNEIEHKRFLLQEKYNPLIQQHYKYDEEIEKKYKMAINQDNIDNEYTRKCEEICALDIKLSEQLIDYYKNDIELQNEAYNFGIDTLPCYNAYIRLSQIYEKRKEYSAAINICNLAIKNGYTYESSKSDMFIRKARLEKKLNKMINK